MSLDNDGAVATDVGLRGIVHEINNANNIAVLNISLFGRVIADLLPLLNEYDSLHPASHGEERASLDGRQPGVRNRTDSSGDHEDPQCRAEGSGPP